MSDVKNIYETLENFHRNLYENNEVDREMVAVSKSNELHETENPIAENFRIQIAQK